MSDRWQNAVAIIGVAGRFPGAENVEQLWQNLCEGRESVRPIATAELEDGLTEAQRGQGKICCGASDSGQRRHVRRGVSSGSCRGKRKSPIRSSEC